jgi:hypothetical protein
MSFRRETKRIEVSASYLRSLTNIYRIDVERLQAVFTDTLNNKTTWVLWVCAN